MRRYFTLGRSLFFSVALSVFFVQCKNEKSGEKPEVVKESPVSGAVTILVEESIFPIVEDVNAVFENEYDKVAIQLVKKSEAEILKLIFEDSLRLAILPREFDAKELDFFQGKVTPKMTQFASDAVVFITNHSHKDSLIDYQAAIQTLQNKSENPDLMLVFDNVNSSVVRQFKSAAGITEFPDKNVYFLPSTREVIEYVESNAKAVGVIGLNLLLQPTPELEAHLKNIKVLAVKNPKDGKYYKPSQNNIAEQTYPIIRKLYVLDVQGKSGLGVGFAAYAAGPKGQRVILKSGLVPVNVPPREIVISNKLEN